MELGNTVVTAVSTPGHAPAHLAFTVADRRRGTLEPWLVFTGDSLLVGDVGRPDLHAKGNPEPLARELFSSVQQAARLDDGVIVYPSHIGGSVCGRGLSSNPFSSIGFERRHNEALQHTTRGRLRSGAARRPAAALRRNRRRSSRQTAAAAPHAGVTAVQLGLRANAGQFALLVGINALVGAMVGLERSVLPLIGEQDFGLTSKTAILTFIVAFGLTKAFTNLAAGTLADRVGRKRLLVLGWLLALPVPLLIGIAPGWWLIVVANLFLGACQGLAWSMTVVMKIDLVGPKRRGLALGFNESAGYLGVATAAFLTGLLAASIAPRTLVWVGGAAIALVGLVVSVVFVRDTHAHVTAEQRPTAGGLTRSRSVRRFPSSPIATPSSVPALRPGSSTTSTMRSPGVLLRSISRPTARARRRSAPSRPSTPLSGGSVNSAPAGSPTTSAASR